MHRECARKLTGKHVLDGEEIVDAFVERPRPRGGAVRNVAGSHQVEMPIAEQICRVIYEGLPPREAVSALMGRAVRSETE